MPHPNLQYIVDLLYRAGPAIALLAQAFYLAVLRPRSSQARADLALTVSDLSSSVDAQASRLRQLEVRMQDYEAHVDDLYKSIGQESDEASARIKARLRTKRPTSTDEEAPAVKRRGHKPQGGSEG